MNSAISINNHEIRLTNERWFHITEGHSEIAGYFFEILETLENPDFVYEGNNQELLAVKLISENKFLIVVYKELNNDNKDGFVITSFLSSKINYLKNKKLLWEKRR